MSYFQEKSEHLGARIGFAVAMATFGGCRGAELPLSASLEDGARQAWVSSAARGAGSVVRLGDVVVVQSDSPYRLRALSPASGAVVWDFPLVGGGHVSDAVMWPNTARRELLVASRSTLVSIDADDGRPKWRFDEPFNGPVFEPSLVAGAGDVFLSLSGGRVAAISAETGATKWIANLRVTGDERAGHLALANQVVVACVSEGADGERGSLVGLRRDDGARLWKHVIRPILPGDPRTSLRCWSAPAVNGDVVAVVADDGHVFGLNAVSGTVLWSAFPHPSIQASVDFRSLTSTARGLLVGSSTGAGLTLVDWQTGNTKWRSLRNVSGGMIYPAGVSAEYIAVTWLLSGLAVVDLETGQVRWQRVDGGPDSRWAGVPAIDGRSVFVNGRYGASRWDF